MSDIDNFLVEDFLGKILIDMQNSLATANNTLEDAIESKSSDELRNILLGLAHSLGYLTASFSQYLTILGIDVEGDEPGKKDHRIGFTP